MEIDTNIVNRYAREDFEQNRIDFLLHDAKIVLNSFDYEAANIPEKCNQYLLESANELTNFAMNIDCPVKSFPINACLGAIYLATGRYSDSVECLEHSLATASSSRHTHFLRTLLGIACVKMDELLRAEECFRQVHEADGSIAMNRYQRFVPDELPSPSPLLPLFPPPPRFLLTASD